MDSTLVLFLIIGVVLFPLLWWFFTQRGETPRDHHWPPPIPRDQEVGYGREDERTLAYRSPAEMAYGQRPDVSAPGTATGEGRRSGPSGAWTATQEEPDHGRTPERLGTPVWHDQGALEVGARTNVREETRGQGGPRPGSSEEPRADASGRPVPEEAAPELPQVRPAGRTLIEQLRSRSGLRQAFMLQAIIGPPKALQAPDEDLSAR